MSTVFNGRDSVSTSSYLHLLGNHGLNLFPGYSRWFNLPFYCSMWMGFRIDGLFSLMIAFGTVDPFLTGAISFEIGVL
jgi:hypothetical protein